jgi:lactoylglutathione lyase
MDTIKALFKNAFPYQKDEMNLPVNDLEAAIPFYETIMGFQVLSKENSPNNKAILGRDNIKIGLSENGGDPTQEGCVFEVDNVEKAFTELTARGLKKENSAIDTEVHEGITWKVFYVIAPDGLCYCIGERKV